MWKFGRNPTRTFSWKMFFSQEPSEKEDEQQIK
jgi:hypothetical protein